MANDIFKFWEYEMIDLHEIKKQDITEEYKEKGLA